MWLILQLPVFIGFLTEFPQSEKTGVISECQTFFLGSDEYI